jgi:hypothetical protein
MDDSERPATPLLHTGKKEAFMLMAIAVETKKHPDHRQDYKVWYLELNRFQDVVGVGVKTREELVNSVFTQYRKTGKSGWRAFLKDRSESKEIEIFDFIAQNSEENTHFGNLPTLSEFHEVIEQLKLNLEIRAIA